MNAIRVMAWAFSMVCVAGCGGAEAGAPATGAPTTPASTTSTTSTGDQTAVGAKLYAENCASCHGNGGEGTAKVPAVVGKSALPLDAPAGHKRNVKFHTAADIFAWVKANMPPDKPGSLTDEQYAAILAFDLKANGVDMTGKKLDAATAPSFVLHP